MRSYFPYQTGNMSFEMSFVAQNTNGEASINFGCEGISGAGFSFSLKSGNLMDSDGIYFGSYLPNNDCFISGIFFGDSCSYFYGDRLVRSVYASENQDVDFVEFSKSNSGAYSFSYSIAGKNVSEDNSLLYITESGDLESGVLGLLSGMSVFGRIETGYSQFTGTMTSGTIENMSGYNAIIIGQYTVPAHFTDKSGWARITEPVVFLNMKVTTGIELLSGSFSRAPTWGKRGDVSEKTPTADIYLRRGDVGLWMLGLSGYELYDPLDDTFFDYEKFGDTESVLRNIDNNFPMIDYIESGHGGMETGPIQSGIRIFFNVPDTIDGTIFDRTTENWKKIFLACVYDLVD